MIKRLTAALLLTALLLGCLPALAVADPSPEQIRDAVLINTASSHHPNCEFFAAGYHILGQQRKGDRLELYLAASAAGYGFLNGAFAAQTGWGGACAVRFQLRDGAWQFMKLLEVESSADIPSILSASAYRNYQAWKDDGSIEQDKQRQVQAYLQSIGRSEPVLDYADLRVQLSGKLVVASNLLISQDYAYPVGIGTRERLEEDGRFLYTRAWQPDAEGVRDPVVQGAHGPVTLSGTTGLETLTRTRKADGAVLETITMRVTLDSLQVDLKDASGSARYLFPFDLREKTYRKPTVTREGFCRIDTRFLERAIRELPGAQTSTPMLEASAEVGSSERFSVLKDGSVNILVYSRLVDGAWQEQWRNPKLLPLTNRKLHLSDYPVEKPALHEYPRFSAMRGSGLGIYAGEEHADLAVTLNQDEQGVWRVSAYNWTGDGLYAYLFPDCLLLNFGDLSAHAVGGIRFDRLDTAAERFDAADVLLARERLTVDTEGAPEYSDSFANTEPLRVNLQKDQLLPVHVSPDMAGPRAGQGKATVSLNSWLFILAKRDHRLFILYETGPEQYRTGWIDPGRAIDLFRVMEFVQPAQFLENARVRTTRNTLLFDDPVNRSGEALKLKKGVELKLLADDSDIWYVEAVKGGQKYWGFVKAEDVERLK